MCSGEVWLLPSTAVGAEEGVVFFFLAVPFDAVAGGFLSDVAGEHLSFLDESPLLLSEEMVPVGMLSGVVPGGMRSCFSLYLRGSCLVPEGMLSLLPVVFCPGGRA